VNFTTNSNPALEAIVAPKRMWSPREILVRSCPVPYSPGVYGWYFSKIPTGVDAQGCVRHGDLTLLYVGISPKAAPKNGSDPSRENLRTRIRYHLRGNAEGSTLRLTLGCLLQEELGIQLRRVGNGRRKTFSVGEGLLSQWMVENALVCWAACDEPWTVEEQLISRVSLPLNLQGNSEHIFYPKLRAIRASAAGTANTLPILER
jgi:hypothetical protein